jgi:hypothetical protein
VRERLSALLLQTGHREALLPDRSLLPTAMCVSETELLQPLLRSSQVLCSGRLLCSGSVLRSQVLPGSGRLLPGSGCVLCSGSVCGSSVLRSSEVLCSGSGLLRLPGSPLLRSSEMLPGSRDLRLPRSVFSLLPGSGHVLCSGDLCAEVLCPGSGQLLRSGCADLQLVQHVQ